MEKSELQQWLHEEYRQWNALLAEIGHERMEQSGVNGEWSMKDIVAHLTGWQRHLNNRLTAAARGEPKPAPPWPADLKEEDDINAWIYESSHRQSSRELLEEMDQVMQELFTVVDQLPDDVRIEHIEPAFYLVWLDNKRYLASEFFNHFHDDHEPDVRAWLSRVVEQ